MNPRDLDNLRQHLPGFNSGEPLPAAFADYQSFYNLDFSDRYPQAALAAGTVASGPYHLLVQHWQQPGADTTLLLVHGYFDHTGIYNRLIDYGLSRGCNVVIFDLPGHGLSTGERACIGEFADYGRAIDDVLTAVGPGDRLLALGQSTGCAALMEYSRARTWPFERTALLAPLVRPSGWFGVRTAYRLLHRFTESVARKFNTNSSDTDFLAFVRRDPLQSHRVSLRWIGALDRWLAGLPLRDLGVGPVLVVQGRRDTTVDWRYNMKAVQKLFPGSDVAYLEKAGHQLANESKGIREAYNARLDAHFGFSAGS